MTSDLHAFRPCAVPLVTADPYMSTWSMSDRLFDDWPRHWTGVPHSMTGIIRVDGEIYRFMGGVAEDENTARQINLEVRPTQSVYSFACGDVALTVTFTSPLLLDDLELLSRPVSYVAFDVVASDDEKHAVQVYFDISGEWAVNRAEEQVSWQRIDHASLDVMRVGSVAQPVLEKRGDDLRIDWGWLYLATPKGAWATRIGDAALVRSAFAATGTLPENDWAAVSHPANFWGGPALASTIDLVVCDDRPQSAYLLVAYDDEYAVEYFHTPLRAWWRRKDDASATKLLADASADYPEVMGRCRDFDTELMSWAEAAGGWCYARLVSLVYRQAVAAHKLVAGPEGECFFFSKENNSNGCICTVDVTYPSTPLFLIYNPDLVKGMLTPILDYCRTDDWPFPFAAHDLGTYPQANGQVYGSNRLENQMPVEESGNLLILCAAISQLEGTADYVGPYWDLLTKWAHYLRDQGSDPGDQLCTDDFAGRLARNANLSIKAILGLASYGRLAEMLGQGETAAEYLALAHEYAAEWERLADDGDHTRLTFDLAGTWSLKYNLVWDKLLGFDLFPPEVARKEIAHYLRVQNVYGVPLDSRRDYTKSDWVMWCAALAETRDDFDALVAPIYRFVNETTSRVPVSDWHDTKTGVRLNFKARSVVGGYFMKLLMDKVLG